MKEKKVKIYLVGNPNVGKSVIFNYLTGLYMDVSNYPGTTVEVARGLVDIRKERVEVVDTPGIYSLLPVTEDEWVTRRILFQENCGLIIHVVDAKNIRRMLTLTLQLKEAGFPIILVLNIMDEARRFGMNYDIDLLQKKLNIPVVATVSTSGEGLERLKDIIYISLLQDSRRELTEYTQYEARIEQVRDKIGKLLKGRYSLDKKLLALYLLQQDEEIFKLISKQEGKNIEQITGQIKKLENYYGRPLSYIITLDRQKKVDRMLKDVVSIKPDRKIDISQWVSQLTVNPVSGLPILILVLLALYQFVGVLGAQVIVDFLEKVVFSAYLNPFIIGFFRKILSSPLLLDLFVGEYGIMTLAMRYAFALILPIVATFFLAFSFLEDSGYFPRVALLLDRLFKKFGLSGRAVIPLILGLGCSTMATITTRILEGKRERLIATFLLALTVPCSAQLGIIAALLSKRPSALLIWGFIVLGVFLFTGTLINRLLPGTEPDFYIEVPILRWPQLRNVINKTISRIEWYFIDVFPMLITASIIIWLGRVLGIFQLIVGWIKPLVMGIGLPGEAAISFIFGFLRRDYGAAGLYDLVQQGHLSENQLIVAVVVMTLFVPCLAQLMMMIKERGIKSALAIVLFIFPFAFMTGYILNIILNL